MRRGSCFLVVLGAYIAGCVKHADIETPLGNDQVFGCGHEGRRAVEERVLAAQDACRDAWSASGNNRRAGGVRSDEMIAAKMNLESYLFRCGTEDEQSEDLGDFYEKVWHPSDVDLGWSSAWYGCFGTPPGEKPYCGVNEEIPHRSSRPSK